MGDENFALTVICFMLLYLFANLISLRKLNLKRTLVLHSVLELRCPPRDDIGLHPRGPRVTDTMCLEPPGGKVAREAAPAEAATPEVAPLEAAPLEAAPLEVAPQEAAPLEAAPQEVGPRGEEPTEAGREVELARVLLLAQAATKMCKYDCSDM